MKSRMDMLNKLQEDRRELAQKRQDGYYWILFNNRMFDINKPNNWQPASWDAATLSWAIIGSRQDIPYYEPCIVAVNEERQPNNNEPQDIIEQYLGVLSPDNDQKEKEAFLLIASTSAALANGVIHMHQGKELTTEREIIDLMTEGCTIFLDETNTAENTTVENELKRFAATRVPNATQH
jgi:hypothetical protein